jgi:hypothetical protein
LDFTGVKASIKKQAPGRIKGNRLPGCPVFYKTAQHLNFNFA